MRAEPAGRISVRDVVAGLTVALVLIPQGMAYAELAGLPSQHGLWASTFPLIIAAFFASSPYLQSGPVAIAGLLTLGALVPLAPVGSVEYARLAALLALVVGTVRICVGLTRAGWLIYLMSYSMMTGFLSAAAILIIASQVPGGLGSVPPVDGVLGRAVWALAHPGSWQTSALALTGVTIVIVGGARRVHPLVPGVLIATAIGLAYSALTGYTGATVGEIPTGLPPLSLSLPWGQLPKLLIPGAVIAVVGFADAASVSRLLASLDRHRWDANREFFSRGLADLVAGVTSGLPIGGSLSRTTLNRLAGARSRWSGLVSGAAVLLFLPFASVLSPLPKAVLAGIVIAAIWSLLRPRPLLALWRASPPQAVVGWSTFLLTLVLAPHVEQAVLLGVVIATAIHLWREMSPGVTSRREGDTLYIEPKGVLWFGSAPAMEDGLLAQLAEEPDVSRVVVLCGGLGRIDLTGAHTLAEMLEQGRRTGLEMVLEDVPEHAARVLEAVGVMEPTHEAASDGAVPPGTRERRDP